MKQAMKILQEGGIIIFPTDTAFGIGCRIDREDSVERLFKLRQRPFTQAMPVLASSEKMVREYVLEIPENVKLQLMDMYWPGALTIVLPARKEKVCPMVRGNGESIGMRVPNHPVPLTLIEELRVPIVGTSANFHGKPTPYEFSDLDPDLIKQVDYVLPGVCTLRKESTVIDCTQTPWKILRQGAVKVS